MTSSPDCFSCHCRDCTVLKSCSRQWLSLINERKEYIKYRKGQLIIPSGIPVDYFFFVYHGKIKVVSAGLYGKQQIKRLATTGDIIGLRNLARDNNHPVSVYALEDSALCAISKDLFLDVLKANPDLMFETLKLVTSELVRTEQRMKSLTTLNVREKVAEALLYINEVFGHTHSGELDVVLSRQEIAEIAMTTKEQVSKCLSEFESESKIYMDGKKIFIKDIELLKNMAGVFS